MDPVAVGPPEASAPAAPSPFAKLVAGLGHEVDQGERMMHAALHGARGADTQTLLALQAGVYRYTEAVDLSAKLVDRTTSGVRTVLSGQ
jgi:hypothetical protein